MRALVSVCLSVFYTQTHTQTHRHTHTHRHRHRHTPTNLLKENAKLAPGLCNEGGVLGLGGKLLGADEVVLRMLKHPALTEYSCEVVALADGLCHVVLANEVFTRGEVAAQQKHQLIVVTQGLVAQRAVCQLKKLNVRLRIPGHQEVQAVILVLCCRFPVRSGGGGRRSGEKEEEEQEGAGR